MKEILKAIANNDTKTIKSLLVDKNFNSTQKLQQLRGFMTVLERVFDIEQKRGI